MTSESFDIAAPVSLASIQSRIDDTIDGLLSLLPDSRQLGLSEARGIIARYTSVLEGNFIYWMTGAYLAVKGTDSSLIILDNLREEVRDCHPGMLRKFAVAAHALPTAADAMAVSEDLMNVRLFVGRLSGVKIVIMMAFFEKFIQRFMAFLAKLADRQGSAEMEYTTVHGECDIGHSEELFRAIATEVRLDDSGIAEDLFEGVDLLRILIESIIKPARRQDEAAQ